MKTVLLLIATGLLFNVSVAQWQTNGPWGAGVLQVATSGSNVYAATIGGFYVSTNSGSNWSWAGTGLLGVYANVTNDVFVSGALLYAECDSLKLSTNNGVSWSANTGFPSTTMRALVSSGGNIFAGSPSGIFLSTNDGTSWTQANTGLSDTNVFSLVISGPNIFAGTYYGGIFLSTNNGSNWTAVNNGLTGYLGYPIQALAANNTNVFAIVRDTVFTTVNNGATWTYADNGLPNVGSLAVNSSGVFVGSFLGGVYFSSDNGGSWAAVNNGLSPTFISSLATSGSNVYAGTGNGVYLTTDNGNSWAPATQGISNYTVTAFATMSDTLLSATSGGLYYSTNNGSTWALEATGLAGLAGPYIYDAEASVTVSGSNIFAGYAYEGVYFSGNYGNTWTQVNTGMNDAADIYTLASMGAIVFAGTNSDNYGFAYKTTNNGANWTRIFTGASNYGVNQIIVNGSILYLATAGDGINVSADSGATWKALNAGLPGNANVSSLAINGSQMFAGLATGGVYMSNNSGSSWTAVNNGISAGTYVNSVAINGENIYAGLGYPYQAEDANGVFLSTDDGASWLPFNSGLTYRYINCLFIHDSTIFAGTDTGGVWQQPLAGTTTGIHVIQESPASQWRLYPNPAGNVFTIETTGSPRYSGQPLQLFDLTGQLLLSQSIQNSKTTVDVSGLAVGVYLVSLKSEAGMVTQKLLITR